MVAIKSARYSTSEALEDNIISRPFHTTHWSGSELSPVVQASTSGRDRINQVERNRNSRNIGRLLERGLQATLPATHFPFAVRLNVDLLSGDGSEAMAALSAASLALGDAGVAVQEHVAGLLLPASGLLHHLVLLAKFFVHLLVCFLRTS